MRRENEIQIELIIFNTFTHKRAFEDDENTILLTIFTFPHTRCVKHCNRVEKVCGLLCVKNNGAEKLV